MIINVHAGHNPDGKTACGAVGLIKESTEARAVKNEVITLLRSLGHTVYDCTVDDGKNQTDILQKIVKKCNANKVDLDISIHFNAGGGNGTEIYVYNNKGTSKTYADNILRAICNLGFKSRGVKVNPDLYVLKKTVAQALLVECCFVDSAEDVKKYNYKTMAQAIVKGITGQTVTASAPVVKPTVAKPTVAYYPAYTGNSGSIVTGLNTIGVNSSFNYRKSIAIKNGISNYSGTAQQNVQLLNLLKQGKLVKV